LIKKAVLPAAGLGTRFLPASKATPKEMLPIIDKPLIQYAVEEAIDVGINEIVFITSSEKYSIKKHFDHNDDIQTQLLNTGKKDMIEKVNPSIFSGIKFHYINQVNQNGLGDAILHAKDVIGEDPFAVLLPDDLFFSKKSCLSQLIEIYEEKKSTVLAVNQISKSNIHKYGVIKPEDVNSAPIKVEDIVEKPSADEAPSDIAVCGRYIFNASIFKYLADITFDRRGELQLTDAIKLLLGNESVYASMYQGEKFDCGSKEGFVHATIALALRDKTISKDIKQIIREII
tara:strand:+ start:161 stop:1021 length:861 start_codon:yes stop_codon:yes gene_type:complete